MARIEYSRAYRRHKIHHHHHHHHLDRGRLPRWIKAPRIISASYDTGKALGIVTIDSLGGPIHPLPIREYWKREWQDRCYTRPIYNSTRYTHPYCVEVSARRISYWWKWRKSTSRRTSTGGWTNGITGPSRDWIKRNVSPNTGWNRSNDGDDRTMNHHHPCRTIIRTIRDMIPDIVMYVVGKIVIVC